MSGMTCAACGRGDLPDFRFGWDLRGRLAHDVECLDDNDERVPFHDMESCSHDHFISCTEVHGLRDGMVKCALGEHVVWPNVAVLAERRHRFNDDDTLDQGRLIPRHSGFEPYVVVVDWAFGDNIDVPEDTRAVVLHVERDGTPILACRDCASREWSSDSKLTPYKAPGGGKPRGSRRRAATTETATQSASDGLTEKIRDLITGRPMTVAEIADATGLSGEAGRKTAQRVVRSLGAAKVREGKSIRWSLGTGDTQDTGPSSDVSMEDE